MPPRRTPSQLTGGVPAGVVESRRFLRRGGALLLELGGDEADALRGDLERADFTDVHVLVDEDGDVRGVEATLSTRAEVSGHGHNH